MDGRAGGALAKLPRMEWHIIYDWRDWLRAGDKSPLTVRLRLHQLQRFAEAHPHGWRVTTEQMLSYLSRTDWKTETRRSARAALRSFYGWLHASGRADHDPSRMLPAIKPAHHVPRPAPESVIAQALGESDPRVRLMLTLAARQGLRRGEIARVHTDDLVEDLTGLSLVVHGKGSKDRVLPLDEDVARDLSAVPRGWVFPGRVEGHLSADYVGRVMARALPGGWTAHPLRHRFGTTAYAGTLDLLAVQEALGHSRPETTRQYIRLPQDSLRRVVAAARLPAAA